jgi:hypothetical protein
MKTNQPARARLRRASATAGIAAAVALAGAAAAAAAPSPASAQVLTAGQTGSRTQIPWRSVGAGWTLATDTTAAPFAGRAHPGRTKVYLVDPDGGKYALYTTSSGTVWVRAWSGNARLALLTVISKAGAVVTEQLTLTTGRLSRLNLPAGTQAVAYTRPAGTSLLAVRNGAKGERFARYTLSGRLEKRLATIANADTTGTTAYSPDGDQFAISTYGPGQHIDVIDNATGAVTRLPAGDGCAFDGWWNASTLLSTSCSGRQVYLVPAAGGRKHLLASTTRAYQYLGGAIQVGSRTYVQASGPAPGSADVLQLTGGHLDQDGADPRGLITGASATRLMLFQQDGSENGYLASYRAGARSEQVILSAPVSEQGVSTAVSYYTPDGHA